MSDPYVEVITTVKIESPPDYPLRGDMLFARVCETYAGVYGAGPLRTFADRYSRGEPWCVVSDARPEGYLPRPCVPSEWLNNSKVWRRTKGGRRAAQQAFKSRVWVRGIISSEPLIHWGNKCFSADQLNEFFGSPADLPLGSRILGKVNRSTAVNLAGATSVYDALSGAVPRKFNIIVDTRQVSIERVQECITLLGRGGQHLRGGPGEGRFSVLGHDVVPPTYARRGQSVLTLAPSAPQGQGMSAKGSFYKTFVHFGKRCLPHPVTPEPAFETPLLLAMSGAVFTPSANRSWTRPFFGKCVGGEANRSVRLRGSLHQGYSPYLPIEFGTTADADSMDL